MKKLSCNSYTFFYLNLNKKIFFQKNRNFTDNLSNPIPIKENINNQNINIICPIPLLKNVNYIFY